MIPDEAQKEDTDTHKGIDKSRLLEIIKGLSSPKNQADNIRSSGQSFKSLALSRKATMSGIFKSGISDALSKSAVGKGKFDYIHNEGSQKISYTRLKHLIDTIHPRRSVAGETDVKEPFSIMDEVGSLSWCICCREKDENGENIHEITELDTQIGLGATLFL